MPQTSGPVVVPGNRTNIFAGALGSLIQPLAGAAGGFLSDMFYDDPNKEYIRAQVENMEFERKQKEMADYDQWLAKRDTPHGVDSLEDWGKIYGRDRAWAEEHLDSYRPTTETGVRVDINQGIEKGRGLIGDAPATIPGAVAAATPPIFQLPNQPDTSATADIVLGEVSGQGAAAPVAPASQAGLPPAAVAPATTDAVTAAPVPPSPRPEATMAPVAPPAERLRELQHQNQQRLGLLQQAQLAQQNTATMTPEQLQAVRTTSAALVQSTVDDLDEAVRIGRASQGLRPDPNKNYGELALLAQARIAATNPTLLKEMELSGPEGKQAADAIRANAKKFDDWYLTNPPRSELDYVKQLQSFLPDMSKGGALLQYELGLKGLDYQEKWNQREDRRRGQQLAIQEKLTDAQARQIAAVTGLTQEQARGLGLENQYNALVQSDKVEAFKEQVAAFKQQRGWAEGDHQLDRLSKLILLQSHGLDALLKVHGPAMQIKQMVTSNSQTLVGLERELNNKVKIWTTAQDGLQENNVQTQFKAYMPEGIPTKKLEQDYIQSPEAQKVAAELAGARGLSSVTPSMKAEALMRVRVPAYREYKEEVDRLQSDISAVKKQRDSLLQQDGEYRAILSQVMKANPNSPATAADLALQSYMVRSVNSMQQKTRQAVDSMPLKEATDYVQAHPFVLDTLMGAYTVDGKGRPQHNGLSFTPNEFQFSGDGASPMSIWANATIYSFARYTKANGSLLTEEAFLNSKSESSTLGKRLGTDENRRKAYQLYRRLRGT